MPSPSSIPIPPYAIGLELEVQNIPLQTYDIIKRINNAGFKVTSDASVESTGSELLGKRVYALNKSTDKTIPIRSKVMIGGEIISQPILLEYYNLVEGLIDIGSILKSDCGTLNSRSGIHVHVNMGSVSTQQLKSIIRWATRIEAIMYRIGSIKTTHRGVENNYNYCRPITKDGPCVVPTPKGYGQVFNTLDLVRADSKYYDFWEAYGDANNNLGFKYHPVRYHWLNLFSYLKLGTLEFRLFNQTFDPYYLEAIISLCQAVTYTMLEDSSYETISNLDFPAINSIYMPVDVSTSRSILQYIVDRGHHFFNPVSESTVFKLFDESEYPPIKPGLMFSHMMQKQNFTIWNNSSSYIPKALPSDGISKAEFVDRHNIKSSSNDRHNIAPKLRKIFKGFTMPESPKSSSTRNPIPTALWTVDASSTIGVEEANFYTLERAEDGSIRLRGGGR